MLAELLKNRPTILKEADKEPNRRLTPDENVAVIKMYGGVMFPASALEKTPGRWLFKVKKALQRLTSRDAGSSRDRERRNSNSSNSSLSSERGLKLIIILLTIIYI